MKNKERLDVLLTTKGIYETREQAKRAIMAGIIKVNNEIIDKPGTYVPLDSEIAVKGEVHPYVSRGGLKLAQAIEEFNLDMNNKVVLDIGASTGGFTDCSLQHGAKEVYAIDVGYGQLAWSLRQDNRVHVMERTNFRYLKKEDLKFAPPNFATIDVSFISLKIILANLINLLDDNNEIVCLVKPQFEAGKELVGKKGIVKDPEIHKQVLRDVAHYVVDLGLDVCGISYSPIKGGEGNIEFLLYLRKQTFANSIDSIDQQIINVVQKAHLKLNINNK